MMKTVFTILTSLAIYAGSALAVSVVPDAFPQGGTGTATSSSGIVVLYQQNSTGLMVTSPEGIQQKLSAQPVDNQLIQELMGGITPPVTAQKIAAALQAYIAANPANAARATAMAVVIAHRNNLGTDNKLSIIAAGVQALAPAGSQAAPSIAALIGFAAELAPQETRPAVVAQLRQLALSNMPGGMQTSNAVTLDASLVQNGVLVPVTVAPESVPVLMAQANQQDMVVELVTPFSAVENQTGQIAVAAAVAGQGGANNIFGSGGAVDTPDNPSGVNNPIAGPTPTPTPSPTPTPPQPYSS